MNKIRDLKYKIKYKFQRAKKGYCDEDLFSIHDWFMDIFPKMLDEFADCTCGTPCNDSELLREVFEMPDMWKEQQRARVNKILKKYDDEYDLNNTMCCWILIILRMKYCFEMCDEWNKEYEGYWDEKKYDNINEMVEKHKKEGFHLLEKYFFSL